MSKLVISTLSGYLDLNDPSAYKFPINEICRALSHVCRYAGQLAEPYSVAQHSVVVSHLVPEEHALAGLLHDASEAYMGDVVTCLKGILPEYKSLESNVQREIYRQYGLPERADPCVKRADRIALAGEVRDLLPWVDLVRDAEYWPGISKLPMPGFRIEALAPGEARSLFMARFTELTPVD